MTKTKAIEQLLDNSRAVVDPIFARKIAKVFGYTLSQLGIKPTKVKNFNRLNFTETTANLTAVSISRLASEIAIKEIDKIYKTDEQKLEFVKKYKSLSYGILGDDSIALYISSPMHGAGSSAEWITEASVEIIKDLQK